MDDLDRLAERELIAGPARIAASRKPDGPIAKGTCLYCDEDLPDGRRWCNAEHLQAWEKERNAEFQRPYQ